MVGDRNFASRKMVSIRGGGFTGCGKATHFRGANLPDGAMHGALLYGIRRIRNAFARNHRLRA